jgi:hypothetical protein
MTNPRVQQSKLSILSLGYFNKGFGFGDYCNKFNLNGTSDFSMATRLKVIELGRRVRMTCPDS